NKILNSGAYEYLWASGKNRISAGSARSLVREDDIFRYIAPTQNQGNGWKKTGYNDSNWDQGQGGFGYGDGDDVTNVSFGTRSVFVRKTFNIENVNAITNLYLDIDFDDAFVAFINGVEITRDNIDGAAPNYLSLANTDKEAKIYTGGDPDHYDLMDFLDLLQDGENVLAIQVHNNVTSSSDLTLRPFLTARYNTTTQDGSEVHPLLKYRTSRLHTDFKVSSESETIYVIEPNGNIHDSIVIANLPTEISFGYTPFGNLRYFNITTPDEINSSLGYQGVLNGEILFSNNGGQVDALTLALSTSEPFTSIRYTTDSTIPDATSTLHTTPINISSSTTIRARLFRDGYLPSKVASRNYIIDEDHLLPVVSLITDPKNLFDEEDGIYAYGNNFTNEFPFFGANFWKDEEKPIHISYYGMDNELKVALNGGVKIFGGWSRANDQRSLSLFARKKYGLSDIKYPIFEERSYQSYGSIVLRNAGNDNLVSNMRDIITHELIKDLDLESQAYQSVVTYINKEYWGMYHLREKVNEHFLARRFDVDPDSIDLLEFNAEIIQGSNTDYLSLLNLVSNADVSSPDIYVSITDQIDIDNFIDYYAVQIYTNNTDWPGNNNKYWRHKNGKWRWILFDTDFSFNLFEEFGQYRNTIAFVLEANGPNWPNPPWATQLFRGLFQNRNFRIDLVNRLADFMNSRFLPENIVEIIETKMDVLQPEISRHYIRWSGNIGTWNQHINRMKNFALQRPNLMKGHILSEFNLPNTHTLNIVNNEIDKGFVEVSTLTIKNNNWSGDYFEDNPYPIKAIALPGYEFSHWSGSVNSSFDALELDMSNNMMLIPHFKALEINEPQIVINEINYKSSDESDAGDWLELHNPSTLNIDLSSWIIKDDNDEHEFIIPDMTLTSGDFIVIVENQEKFTNVHSDVETIENLGFGLGGNDQVRIFNAADELIDSVSYSSMAPWPNAANGNGYTLELLNPILDNTLPENYEDININGSPGRRNVLETNSVDMEYIESISIFPNPASDQLNIVVNASRNSQFDVTVLDAMGRTVIYKNNLNYNLGDNKLTINVKHLINGIYRINIKNNDGHKANKSWIKL
ncbi:MAG TPA: hypothetical protein DGP89_06810, partial [Saprospirales bacterium]|nr:hypothetical protein [Saprospirales bacterium]